MPPGGTGGLLTDKMAAAVTKDNALFKYLREQQELVSTAAEGHTAGMGANQRQVGGDHYKVGGEEHWDRAARLKLDYFQACITKYVERWDKKNGIQDLEKARHFLDKYLEIQKAAAARGEVARRIG